MERKTTNLVSSKTLDLVQVALMAAIIFIATKIIHFPSGMGVIHLGDSMIFLTAMLFGRKKAAAASAIGMSLFDILSGYMTWAPYTFFIKGIMGYIAGAIAYRKNYDGKKRWNNLVACIVAGVFMIAAYFVSGSFINKVYYGMPLTAAYIKAAGDIFTNILQVVAGIVIAMPLSYALKDVKVNR